MHDLKRWLPFLFAITVFSAGCRCSEPVPPSGSDPTSSHRSENAETTDPNREDGEPILGWVFDHPITSAETEETLRRAPERTDEKAGVILAAGRWLAQMEAERMGVARRTDENDFDYVDRFLGNTFNKETTCRSIDDKTIADRYRLMKNQFVHPDTFDTWNIQIICCPKGQAPCVDNPIAAACFEEELPVAQEILATLGALHAEPEALVAHAQTLPETHTGLGVTRLRFAYDFEYDRHEQPGRWAVMDPAILQAVRFAKNGDLIGPVRSEYGYHLLFVQNHKTKENRSLERPDVREAVIGRICLDQVQRMRHQYLLDLTKSVQLRVDNNAIRQFSTHREKTAAPSKPTPSPPVEPEKEGN